MVLLGLIGILWEREKGLVFFEDNGDMKHEVRDHEYGGWRWMLMLKNLG